MADIWKTEYHVIGVDDEAYAWLDDYDEAMGMIGGGDCIRIDAVTYYHNDTETVWEAEGQPQ